MLVFIRARQEAGVFPVVTCSPADSVYLSNKLYASVCICCNNSFNIQLHTVTYSQFSYICSNT